MRHKGFIDGQDPARVVTSFLLHRIAVTNRLTCSTPAKNCAVTLIPQS